MTNPTMMQVIGEGAKAKRDESLDLSDKDLLRMFETMVRVRALDTKLTNLQRQGRIGFYLAGTGQEATQVGMAYALEPDDWMFPHYRDPASALTRGVDLKLMVHQCFGNVRDVVKGRQMPVHYSFREQNYFSISSPLATQIPHAVGAAWAMKIRGDKKVALTSFGDGSSSEGDFHVAMNFAGVYKVPCVFVLENNQWAISVPLKWQTASETFAQKAEAYGFEGLRVDGNDVLAVYKATKAAVDKARSGGGPTLIECYTYRMTSHSTSDEATRYQPKDEVETWRKRDPIDRFGTYLSSLKLLDAEKVKSMREAADQEVSAAIKEAEAEAAPAPETMFDDVYEKRPAHLEAQAQRLREEMEE